LQGHSQGLRHHDHARTAAKRAVIYAAVVSQGVIPRVVQVHLHQARLERPSRNTRSQKWWKQLRKQRYDIKSHGIRAQ
jgi:NADH:ubiquinone oxidoreductase subunit